MKYTCVRLCILPQIMSPLALITLLPLDGPLVVQAQPYLPDADIRAGPSSHDQGTMKETSHAEECTVNMPQKKERQRYIE